MSGYWCELAWLGGDRAEAGVAIELDGERIAAVEPGVAAPPPGTSRLDGLTLPGFANAHSHAFHRALRGRVQRRGGSFWTWREDMYAIAARIDPDTYLRLARATFAEMALAGITAVGEFHYLHHQPGGRPYADPNEIGRVLIAAAREAGIRITLLDTCYLDGGIGQPLNEVQRRFADADVAAWAERAADLSGSEARESAPRSTASAPSTPMPAARSPPSPRRANVRCTPISPSSRPRTRPAGRPTAPGRPEFSIEPGRSASGSPRCTPPTSTPPRSRRSGPPAVAAVSARRPSATSPTESALPGRWRRPERGSRWARTRTRHRSLRGGARRRARRAPGKRRARTTARLGAARRRHPRTATPRSDGATPA